MLHRVMKTSNFCLPMWGTNSGYKKYWHIYILHSSNVLRATIIGWFHCAHKQPIIDCWILKYFDCTFLLVPSGIFSEIYMVSCVCVWWWWWDNCFIIQELGETVVGNCQSPQIYIFSNLFSVSIKDWDTYFFYLYVSLTRRHLIAIYHFSHKHMTISIFFSLSIFCDLFYVKPKIVLPVIRRKLRGIKGTTNHLELFWFAAKPND